MDSGIPGPPAVQASQDIRGLQLTLAAYIVIFAAKLAAYFASGVIVVLAEAMHTLSDILISGFLLIAAKYARRQADETHMFGYGRAEMWPRSWRRRCLSPSRAFSFTAKRCRDC